MILNELFDKPYPYTWKQKDNDDRWSASFNIRDGGEVTVNFDPLNMKSTYWEIVFLRNYDTDLTATGEGDEFRIFGTIVKIIQDWYKQQSVTPQLIEFTANKKEGDAKGRAKLYKRFAEKFAKATGMTLDVKENDLVAEFILRVPTTVKEVEIDNRNGRGAVSNNMEIDYFGLRVKMRPSVFLKLAAPLGRDASDEMKDYIRKGGAIGAPFLIINVDGDNVEVVGHEGRNRMIAVSSVEGDAPVETHLFFRGDVSRARHLTPEIVARIRAGMTQENTGKKVIGPLWEDGRVVKGVNTTVDVKPGETRRQAAKFGNKLNNKNEPPLLHSKARKNSTPHVLSNLGLTESFAIDRDRWKDTLPELLSTIQDKMEDIDSASIDFELEKPQAEKLEKDYRALHAIERVILNHQRAIERQLPNNHFLYSVDYDRESFTALHLEINRDVGEIKWLGSYNNPGAATRLINNAKALLKKAGAKRIKLTAKWGSEGFYEKLNFKRDSETRDDPVVGTTYTDMSKSLEEHLRQLAESQMGYKIMNYDPETGRVISGADRRVTNNMRIKKGMTMRMPHPGIFMSTNREYVETYYGGHNDHEVLITFRFDPNKITSGNLTDNENEFTVPEAEVIDFEVIDNITEASLTDYIQNEAITTIKRDKDEKFNVNFNQITEPTGKKLGQMGSFELWFTRSFPPADHPAIQIWDTAAEEAAGIIIMSELGEYAIDRLAPNTFSISTAVVNDGYEGKGIVYKTYAWLVKRAGFALVSDNVQTEGGIKIWQRLAQTQGVNVYAIDTRHGETKYSAVNPKDFSDAGFAIYQDDIEEYFHLQKEYDELAGEIEELEGWIEDADADREAGYDVDGYDEIVDKLKVMRPEFEAIGKEYAAYKKYVDEYDARLMAVADKKVTESEIVKPHPKDTLGVARKDMPQIHKDHYPEFIRYLKDHGASVSTKRVHAKELKPVQSEFSDTGVKKMMKNKNPNKGTTRDKPLIVSSDNYIIDGHHRWLASFNLDEDIPIMQFSIPIKKMFQLVKDFKHTTYKDIHEEVVTEALKDAYPYDISNEGPRLIRAWFDAAKGSTVTAQMAAMDDYYLATLAHYADFDIRDVKGVTSDDVWEFFFKRDGSVELTNKGDQFKIFATVVSIFREFVKRKKPKVIAFSSSKHEEGGKGRTPLYKRFAAAFAKESGYRLREFDLSDEYYFLLFAPGIQIESMSMMEMACLEGGHIYEQDLEEIRTISPLRNDDAMFSRAAARIAQIKDGLFMKVGSYGEGDIYLSNDLAKFNRDGYAMIANKDLTDIISLLRVDIVDGLTVKAGMAWTHPKYRRKGYVTQLYSTLLDRGFNVRADNEQTKQSKMVWQSLTQKYKAYLMRDGEIEAPLDDKGFKLAYKTNAAYNYSILIASPKNKINENISITGTERHREERKKKLEPGTDAWFKHWFSRPYLKRTQIESLKEELREYYLTKKGDKNAKKTQPRRSRRNTKSNESGSTR